jgi:AcrR family transcriptional regulator
MVAEPIKVPMKAPNSPRRDELLAGVQRYLLEHGLSDLSLRPLAAALGTNSRMLIYYFGTKERLIAEALDSTREQEMALYGLPAGTEAIDDALRWIWTQVVAPRNERGLRLYFEVYALALQKPELYGDFARSSLTSWITFAEGWLRRAGVRDRDCATWATIVVDLVRGVTLDLLATGDRTRADAAVDELAHLLASTQRRRRVGRRKA